jgi:hypothetical protein
MKRMGRLRGRRRIRNSACDSCTGSVVRGDQRAVGTPGGFSAWVQGLRERSTRFVTQSRDGTRSSHLTRHNRLRWTYIVAQSYESASFTYIHSPSSRRKLTHRLARAQPASSSTDSTPPTPARAPSPRAPHRTRACASPASRAAALRRRPSPLRLYPQAAQTRERARKERAGQRGRAAGPGMRRRRAPRRPCLPGPPRRRRAAGAPRRRRAAARGARASPRPTTHSLSG